MTVEKNLSIGLVQINNSFSGQNYLPYSVGMLRSYVYAYANDPEQYFFLPFIYKRAPISDIVKKLISADIVGFSAYVWNARISLEIAKRLKAKNPEMLVIFGGPHVPDNAEEFLREYSFIDVAIHNEGEKTFMELLQRLPNNNYADINGVSFLNGDQRYVKTESRQRFRDLEEIPSPFLEGVFDEIITLNPDENWIGLWETNRGCPFRCTFCDWGSATAAKVTKFGLDRLKAEAEWFANKKIEYIFCCDANFGIQKRDVEIAEYVSAVKKKTGYPHRLSVQNTKNATERAYLTQKILSNAGLNQGVALSMQTLDMGTLESIKRDNISLDTYLELQRRFTNDKVETFSDLILGLPGETYDSFVDGIDTLIQSGQHNRVQFNNLTILPNAEMGDPAYQKKYGLQTIESEIINIHGERVELDDDVAEIQQLVIATNAMPLLDWQQARTLCWITALLHYDKIFQIPLIVAHELTNISYRELLEGFMTVDSGRHPMIGEIYNFFMGTARSIQNGGPEYVYSPEWLGIYWPADEYIFIKLTRDGTLSEFLDEVGKLVFEIIGPDITDIDRTIIEDSIRLNKALVNQPFYEDDLKLTLSYDILSFYNDIKTGKKGTLNESPTRVIIDRTSRSWKTFDDWCREVVWWGNKKGAYLFTNKTYEKQLAGHF